MIEKIEIIFGLDKDGNNIFYVSVGSDKCFWVEGKNAEKELDYELIKSTLGPTEEGINYIFDMYKRWYKEYVWKE